MSVGQKPHRDVLLGQELPMGGVCVGGALVEDKDGAVVEVAQPFVERPPRLLDVGDQDVPQPSTKDITCDEACLGRVDDEVSRVVSVFVNGRVDTPGLRDDGWLQPRAIQRNAGHKCASSC